MFPNQTHTNIQLNNSKGTIRGQSIDSQEDARSALDRAGGVKSSLNMDKMRENLNKTEILTKRD